MFCFSSGQRFAHSMSLGNGETSQVSPTAFSYRQHFANNPFRPVSPFKPTIFVRQSLRSLLARRSIPSLVYSCKRGALSCQIALLVYLGTGASTSCMASQLFSCHFLDVSSLVFSRSNRVNLAHRHLPFCVNVSKTLPGLTPSTPLAPTSHFRLLPLLIFLHRQSFSSSSRMKQLLGDHCKFSGRKFPATRL